MEPTKNRGGRPPKLPGERKRSHFTVRARDALRDQLATAATDEGRSIAEEIEYRLERTFREDLLLGDSLHLRLICQDVGNALRMLEMIAGRRAFGPDGDRWMHEQVENAFADWFDRTRPKGERQAPEGIRGLADHPDLVADVFLGLVEELREAPADAPDDAILRRVRELVREIIGILTTGSINDG